MTTTAMNTTYINALLADASYVARVGRNSVAYCAA